MASEMQGGAGRPDELERALEPDAAVVVMAGSRVDTSAPIASTARALEGLGWRVVRMSAPFQGPAGLQKRLSQAVGLADGAASGPSDIVTALRAAGAPVLVAIDDAHTMSARGLRYLFLLHRLAHASALPLRLLLIGGADLRTTLGSIPATEIGEPAPVFLESPLPQEEPPPPALPAAEGVSAGVADHTRDAPATPPPAAVPRPSPSRRPIALAAAGVAGLLVLVVLWRGIPGRGPDPSAPGPTQAASTSAPARIATASRVEPSAERPATAAKSQASMLADLPPGQASAKPAPVASSSEPSDPWLLSSTLFAAPPSPINQVAAWTRLAAEEPPPPADEVVGTRASEPASATAPPPSPDQAVPGLIPPVTAMPPATEVVLPSSAPARVVVRVVPRDAAARARADRATALLRAAGLPPAAVTTAAGAGRPNPPAPIRVGFFFADDRAAATAVVHALESAGVAPTPDLLAVTTAPPPPGSIEVLVAAPAAP